MDEKQIIEFIQWLPSRIKELQNKSPEEIVSLLNKMSKTSEGKKQIETLIQEFKSENAAIQSDKNKMFKKGGKLDYLVNKFYNGGKNDSRKLAAIKADSILQNIPISEETYHSLPGGPIYTRTTYPNNRNIDTIVSKDDKFYTNNSLLRYLAKLFTGTSKYDEINKSIDSLSKNNVEKYQQGRKLTGMRLLGSYTDSDGEKYDGTEWQYNDGSLLQKIKARPKPGYIIFPSYQRYISPDRQDTIYYDIRKHVYSGPLEKSVTFLGINPTLEGYIWNKEKAMKKAEERRDRIREVFKKVE